MKTASQSWFVTIGRFLLWLVILSTFLFFGAFVYTLVPFIAQFPLYILGAFILGWLGADFVTGMIHWFGDTWGKESWPFFGKYFISDFRVHHIRPKEICGHDFVYMCASSFFFAPYIILGAVYLVTQGSLLNIVIGTFLASTTIWAALTNVFHKWAHDDPKKVPAVVKWLQKHRIILSPDHHQIHHTSPHISHYAITNGWVNNLLGKIRFFRGLEWIISKILRVKPRDY